MAEEQRRCYYEILDVEQSATDQELKKAYRKQALLWHPDKNIDRIEEANIRFKEIQNAYAVLSDPNERKWYDDHRDSILRGGDGTGENDSGLVVNLWPYFSATCFDGFDDTETGFYTVYSKIFTEIAAEEDIDEDFPLFGTSSLDWDSVHIFYSRWKAFYTTRSFSWCDIYKTSDAPNRWVRRQIEKENKKAREKAKKDYNETVRNLAAFCEKRDPRVSAYREAAEKERAHRIKEEEQKKMERKALLQEQRRKWLEERDTKFEETKSFGYRLADEIQEKDFKDDYWFCEACDKTFKSEKQLLNHQQSKKHKQKWVEWIEQNKQTSEEESESEGIEPDDTQRDDSEVEPSLTLSQNGVFHEEVQEENHDINGSKQNAETQTIESDVDTESEDDFIVAASLKMQHIGIHDVDFEAIENGDPEDSAHIKNPRDQQMEKEEKESTISAGSEQNSRNKKKKRRANKKTDFEESKSTSQFDDGILCVSCNTVFDSRNQLFKHLKTTGHAVIPTALSTNLTKEKGKGKKKR